MMSEPIETPPDLSDAEPEEPSQDNSVADDDEVADMRTVRKLRHEAAGLRAQLKEARAAAGQLEDAKARLATLEHAEVERIAAEQLHDGADIWRVDAGTQQSWYDTEFSALQPDKVRESIEALIEAKPHLARPQRPPTAQPLEGLKPGASPEVKKPAVTWASALHRSG